MKESDAKQAKAAWAVCSQPAIKGGVVSIRPQRHRTRE